MIDHTQTMNRGGLSSRGAFPEKANPNRPPRAEGSPGPEPRAEAGTYPESCNPQRSRQPLTAAQRELVTRFMPLACRLARQVKGPTLPKDDLEAEAYAALVEAAQSFDPDRGVNFAVYARPRINGALRDYRRFLFHADWRGDRGELPVFRRLGSTEVLHGRVLGKEPEPPCGWGIETLEAVKSAIGRLPRLNSIACRLLYFEGKSHEETAEILGYSKGHLTRLHHDSLTQLARDHGELLAG